MGVGFHSTGEKCPEGLVQPNFRVRILGPYYYGCVISIIVYVHGSLRIPACQSRVLVRHLSHGKTGSKTSTLWTVRVSSIRRQVPV